MAVIEETCYLGRDNAIDLAIKANGVSINHLSVSKAQVVINNGAIIDSDSSPSAFDFSSADKIRIRLGGSHLTPGKYNATLVIYDSINANGIVVGDFLLVVK